MRVLMQVSFPVEAGNKGVKDGSLPKAVMNFVERYKPESTVFTAVTGKRTGFFVFDLKETSEIPSIAEPFFNQFDAEIHLMPAMNLEEMRTGVERAMKMR
jgi:hypothetical protein